MVRFFSWYLDWQISVIKNQAYLLAGISKKEKHLCDILMSLWKIIILTGINGICNNKDSEWCRNFMFVCFIHILLFLSFNARWVRWVWLPTSPTILTDGSLDDLVPNPVPALTYTTAMSHLPSSSVRDHMKWVCFENTKMVTITFIWSLVSLRMLSLMIS